MSELARWGFAVGVGLAAGATWWVLFPLPGLIWRAVCRVARRSS